MHTQKAFYNSLTHQQKRSGKATSYLTLVASAVIGVLSLHSVAVAQENNEEEKTEIIEVRGLADSFRNAIAEKRNAATIVDALSSADMGALPDLSVAETLERITGVTGDRFKGNASEISIRGLGPFLGFSTVNGRAISSGSGNRSVAFSQFPSELVNGVVVYKAQKADLLEGGVSGLVDLKTIKPVDYGKEQFRADARYNYNPYMKKIGDEGGWGIRLSTSYTNSIETDDWGKVGFAIGYAGRDTSSPEESYNTSSTLRNCNSNFAVDGGSNCSFSDARAAANGCAAEDGPFYFIPNSFYYRQMKSEEDRDAVIMALQWQPNSNLDINLDGQWSNRFYYEDRHDLFFDDGRRRIANWTTNDENILLNYTGNSRISSYGEYRQRDEDYKGLGLNVDWQATDDLGVEFDAAYSGTERWQTRTYARFRGDRVYYDWQNSNGENWPQVTRVYTDFEDPQGSEQDWLTQINDLSYYDANSEARNYRFDIRDSINSYKLDLDYALDAGIFYEVVAGVHYSNHKHNNYQEERRSLATPSGDRADVLAKLQSECAIPFGQSSYGEDANSNVTSWAQFDTQCGYDAIVGDADLSVDPKSPSAGDVDLSEEVTSFYVMGNFSTEWGEMPVDGNIGLRRVTTDITSVGIRTSYTVVTDAEGNISFEGNPNTVEFSTLENSYSNTLPSVNIALGVLEDVQLRFAAYKGLSRPDMWYYGAGRDIGSVGSDEDFTTVEEALDGNVRARGNPFLEALESNNYDVSASYFVNEDTMLSAAIYRKTFNARFEIASAIEPIVVDGQSYNATVSGRPTIIDEDSDISGFELTALHKLDWLPAPFNGFGFSANYNYASSDFITPERGGNITSEVQDLVEPSDIAGLSKHNFSGQLYWENKTVTARLSYKYRSEYLKPFGPNLAQTNRIVDDTQTLDFDLSVKVSKQLRAKFQVINMTNEPYVEQRVARGSYNRIEYSGPRIFVGLQYKL